MTRRRYACDGAHVRNLGEYPMNTQTAEWLAANGAGLQRLYAGKWVAAFNDQVVGVGDTATEADEQALRAGSRGAHVLQAIEPVEDRI